MKICPKVCHMKSVKNAIGSAENLPQTVSKCIKSATLIINELKICHKIMLYHNKCHKLYPDIKNLSQMQLKSRKSATNII